MFLEMLSHFTGLGHESDPPKTFIFMLRGFIKKHTVGKYIGEVYLYLQEVYVYLA